MTENMILYNASTGGTFDSIEEFIRFYNQCYYISTSHWVETEIEHILQKDKKTAEDFFNIFAWKTGKINHHKSEESKKFCYTVSKGREDKAEWYFDLNNGEAIAITRYGVIAKDKDGKLVPHKLYKYLEYLTRINNSQKRAPGILKELMGQDDIVVPKGIGTVYLITFLYFITKGYEPIYDVFAMTALDAIYPDNLEESKNLGSYIHPRNLPDKNTNSYEKLLSDDRSVYRIYKNKLFSRFVTDYINELGENIKPEEKYSVCRDIDRALWVYGHLFSNTK